MRERPRLAREVSAALDAHADFLGNLAREALLERLAGLDEAGERAVHPGGEVRTTRQEYLVLFANQSHDSGRDPRIGREFAGGAHAHALVALGLGRRAAAAAE